VRWTAVLLTAIVFVALFRSLQRDGPAALQAWRTADVNWTWMSLAIVFALVGQAIFPVGWQRLLNDCGVPISLWQATRIFWVSVLGRYLPGGKAWQMGIVGVMAAEQDLPAATLATTSLLQGIVGAAVGAIMLFGTGGAALGVNTTWLALPLAGIVGLLAGPALLRSWPGLRSAIVRRLPAIESVTTATMWALVWTAVANWIAWGVALYALARALLADPGASIITYLAAWIGPFLAGLVAIVTPAGLGVRDEVMRAMLSSAGVSASAAIMLAVVARVWATAIEVVPAVGFLLLRRQRATVRADVASSQA
jgi:uncharacterized membrane protein YbhN (UPF0104 family)